jgi:predicted RND superfamily exporter protein
VRKGTPEQVVNLALNETLSRTIITSGTTLLTVLALYLFGREVISGFALALMVGIGVGTYSSIYVASSAALLLGISRADMLPVKKEGEAQQVELTERAKLVDTQRCRGTLLALPNLGVGGNGCHRIVDVSCNIGMVLEPALHRTSKGAGARTHSLHLQAFEFANQAALPVHRKW